MKTFIYHEAILYFNTRKLSQQLQCHPILSTYVQLWSKLVLDEISECNTILLNFWMITESWVTFTQRSFGTLHSRRHHFIGNHAWLSRHDAYHLLVQPLLLYLHRCLLCDRQRRALNVYHQNFLQIRFKITSRKITLKYKALQINIQDINLSALWTKLVWAKSLRPDQMTFLILSNSQTNHFDFLW